MSEAVEITYEEWLENRSQLVKIGGIDARIRYVSNLLLEELSAETDLDQILATIEPSTSINSPFQDVVEGIHGMRRTESGDVRRKKATQMRNALEIILPHVLVSPGWLTQALYDFTDDEIYRLYNIVMHARVKN